MSGLKSVDNLIEKYGVSAFNEDNPFIKRKPLSLINACEKGMPFCFYLKLKHLSQGEQLWCFTAYLPTKKQKLAMYLVDQSNSVIEQVYYPRDRKGIVACEKIRKLLGISLRSANVKDFTLAA